MEPRADEWAVFVDRAEWVDFAAKRTPERRWGACIGC